MSEAKQPEPAKSPISPSFWDSWVGLALLIAAIVFGRWYVMEPFKIPSGSMEPTLVGHEDFGDRIVTNKLAFVPAMQVALTMALSTLVIFGGLAISLYYSPQRRIRANLRSITTSLVLFIVIVGGMGLAWSRDCVGMPEPRRFDVIVFNYNTAWTHPSLGKGQDVNYIKRLVGLPGDEMVISGGDLFIKKNEKFEIIRKWDAAGDDLQEILWYPVAKAWHTEVHHDLDPESPDGKLLAFPWEGAEHGGARVEANRLVLDGGKPVHLSYKFPVTNVYLKQGRWPFRHIGKTPNQDQSINGCPAAHKKSIEGPDGVKHRDPDSKPEFMTAYVANTWEGVLCPNCGHLMFPCDEHVFVPFGASGMKLTPFFYGGDYRVGDLKIEMDIDVESSGSIELEVGNTHRRAVWTIPSQADAKDDGILHPVLNATPALAPGKHSLSLAFVDATVIAYLDGREIERRKVDAQVISVASYKSAETIARLSFNGTTGSVTKLNLYRDLFYASNLSGQTPDPSTKDREFRTYDTEGNYHVKIPKDNFLMLGDNSPNSQDGRIWGFVPRDRLMGRAAAVWWPPSRWRMIK